MRYSYDQIADVLYCSKNDPESCWCVVDKNGLVLRYFDITDQPSGITILDLKDYWSGYITKLSHVIAKFLSEDFVSIKAELQIYMKETE